MLWYLLKTWVGREEEVVREIKQSIPSQWYDECFVMYQERIWRKQQKSVVQLKPVFPGCAFLTCPETAPVWHRLERIPAVARLIVFGRLAILPMMAEDARFLERISGREHIIRLSYIIKDDEGNIRRLSEPLKTFQGQVDRIQYKKRYAMAHHRLWGEERIFVLGIALKEDVEEKMLMGKPDESFGDSQGVQEGWKVHETDIKERERSRKIPAGEMA